ncbi:Vacuolar protein-sorting-associated protein 60 [Blastocladiella emersonii ATCC 22665]|nr:Vacuolar protein-sorting-associated protein 60 [Blastocladiella emersonii ATCC 22665]
MNRFFGTAKPQAKPSLNDAISSLDTRSDSIEVKIRKLDAELGRYKEQMAKMRDGPSKDAIKSRAMRVLKQKKLYEGQRDQLMTQSFNIEQAQMATENLRNTVAVVDTMRVANAELKKQYKSVDVAKIEKMQDEMEDLLYSASELQDVMSRSYGLPDEIDEADLEAELEALGDELLFEDDEVPSYLQEPDVPLSMPNTADLKDPTLEPPEANKQAEPNAPLKAT